MDIFISDLHILPNDKKKIKLLSSFCNSIKKSKCNNFFILGDFFDMWLGDDISIKYHKQTIDILIDLTKNNINIFFMIGNRDFLIGKEFIKTTGCILTKEPYVIDNKIVIMHGDSLCTEDIEYQKFKKIVRAKKWQLEFLNKSEEQRLNVAFDIRKHSKLSMKEKIANITDVTQKTVDDFMNKYIDFKLIHGHTHKRGSHKLKNYHRIVLGDWHENSGNAIKIDNNKISWLDVKINTTNNLEILESSVF